MSETSLLSPDVVSEDIQGKQAFKAFIRDCKCLWYIFIPILPVVLTIQLNSYVNSSCDESVGVFVVLASTLRALDNAAITFRIQYG